MARIYYSTAYVADGKTLTAKVLDSTKCLGLYVDDEMLFGVFFESLEECSRVAKAINDINAQPAVTTHDLLIDEETKMRSYEDEVPL